ncbi:Lumen Thiol Oxidoreductase 1 [Hibiscus trionum]|uniref:Lumen Thiol Oxidoreductase 1 n=1 Tax=Hibiscus trionum TaxID=183268 RepID=A0A9W7LKK9_HIBTR|nr:Lumen Thiol Oxidoreductase 1 [Hibiscus trionum]
MAAFSGLSASQSQILCRCSPPISSPAFISPPLHFKKQAPVRKLLLVPLKCSSTGPSQDAESETETVSAPSSSVSMASTNSTYNWRAGIGAVGLLETAYLTYLKLSGSDAFCLLGGGSCGDVLNSDYALIFGLPLPLLGLIAYGFVTTLSLQLSRKNLPLGINETDGRLLLLGITTSMAAASAYFLYILSTKFAGTSCSYCLVSALLSFSLFFISLKDVGLQEVQKVVGLQVCIASLVVATLSTSYSNLPSAPSSAANINLPYFTTEITTKSSPFAISLARHLHSIGAKMYGAFWCSHCQEQKQMFGREAAKLLDYIECFPDGYKTGTVMIKACADANLEGFPTWVINGQVLSGDMELEKLAEVSGFEFNG